MTDELPAEFDADDSLWRRALASEAGARCWESGSVALSQQLGRREALRLLGASVMMAGLAGCTERPRQRILPFSKTANALTPGVPAHYATSVVIDGFAVGVLARSNDGRPTKIDGNPEHPASLGATRPLHQASVLDLYDPMRLRSPRARQRPSSWNESLSGWAEAARGAPPWFVLSPQSSPTVLAQCERLRQRFPGARFSFHSGSSHARAQRAAIAAWGRPLQPQYDLSQARVVVDIGSDFLASLPMSLRYAHDFAQSRRATEPGERMSRLYSVETMPSATSSLADHRLALRPSEQAKLCACLLGEILQQSPAVRATFGSVSLPTAVASSHQSWLRAVAGDLLQHAHEALVIAGPDAPFECQVLVHFLNAALRNAGNTVSYTEPVLEQERDGESLADLVRAIRAGEVRALAILDENVVYSAPPELELGRWLRQVPSTLQLTSVWNETSESCRWVVPLSHYLESWGDARAYDGTLSFCQPLIEPLYATRSVSEVLAHLAGDSAATSHDLLQATWQARSGDAFVQQRDAHLGLGFEPGSAFPSVAARPSFEALAGMVARSLASARQDGLELDLRASPALHDGRFANNAWLQELPHPVTKQTWGNAALLGPSTAAQHGVESSQLVQLSLNGRTLRVPVLIVPGHAEGAVTIELGYGEKSQASVGASASSLSHPDSLPAVVQLRPSAEREPLSITQPHSDPDSRPLGLAFSLDDYQRHPDATEPERKRQLSLLPRDDYRGNQWGMTIDTTICTGCSACVIACQAENNVPVVGKQNVLRGREMHWLRIDRYQVSATARHATVVNQPMLCQHCEKAPCEYVCPVNATVHSPDGLNEMVYNRCIGTRFCSNNCPYKVRRFNWFKFTAADSPARLVRNPAVTVRERGVMEKCTFCVQRLRGAEQQALVERRAIAPGEVRTACQEACPTNAIQFGSLSDRQAAVVTWRRVPRRYEALHELGTLPRVQYLAKIANINPSLEEPA